MSTLWITGAGGVVGSKLVEQAVRAGYYGRIRALSHSPAPDLAARYPRVEWTTLDLGNREAVLEQARLAPPDVVVNPAAMTNVDACETKRDEARRANADGPRWLAEVCRDYGGRLLHVSTDYVFPGDDAQPGPYAEDAPPRAISYYGQSKLDGERAIAAVCGETVPYAIVRTALVYGLGRRANFVTWLAGELRAGRRVRIVRDQFNTPTIADDLAAVLLWLAARQRTGIYHAAGPDLVGRHEWAEAIARHFALDTGLIDWVTSAELAQPAPRPLRSGLTCARLLSEPDAPHLRGIAAGLSEIDWLAAN
ncbi:MAG TPA: SDR family oxidoreductase [Ktedonobacterales bacterium]|nr:SDR family oxidoreductase [Ktedonobacterales bacterium]